MAARIPQNTDDKRITPGFVAQAGKGRPKGTPNKSTKLAKDAIALAAEKLGGADGLFEWAKKDADNERVFWQSIYTKLIPVQVTGEDGGPLRAAIEVTFKSVHAG